MRQGVAFAAKLRKQALELNRSAVRIRNQRQAWLTGHNVPTHRAGAADLLKELDDFHIETALGLLDLANLLVPRAERKTAKPGGGAG